VLIVVCGLVESAAYRRRNNNGIINRDQKWDYLTFTQFWPQVDCLSWQILDPKHKCNITEDVTSWTVHGIWPSSNSSDDPSFCNSSKPFDLDLLEPIRAKLHTFWPNVYANTPEDELWSHEWNKHGRCATTLPALSDELTFFTQGLKWVQQYNLISILSKAGIKPSFSTPVLALDIENAIQNELNVKPLMVCEHIKENKTDYIYEIEICFDKSLNLIDCPSDSYESRPLIIGAERCSKNALVWYPPISPTSGPKKPRRNLHLRSPQIIEN